MPPLNIFQKRLLALGIGQSLIVASAHSASIEVNESCSLVDSIISSQSNTATGGCPAGDEQFSDIIELPANQTFTYTQGFDNGNPYTGLPFITSGLIINGNGSVIERAADASTDFRLIALVGDDARLRTSSLTIRGGSLGGNYVGAGIYAARNTYLRMDDSTVTGNTANNKGGGIYTGGRLTFIDSVLSNNTARLGGGGVYAKGGRLDFFRGNTVTGNSQSGGNSAIGGGAILHVDGTLSAFYETEISNNYAVNHGAGIYVRDTGTLYLTDNTLVENNFARGRGGAIEALETNINVQYSTISGNSALSSGGAINSRAFDEEREFRLRGSKISHNESANSYGGGVLINEKMALEMRVSTVENNSAMRGGGIAALSSGTLQLFESQVVSNFAERDGGGIFKAGSGENMIFNSTISGNTAMSGGGLLLLSADLSLEFATIAANTAAAGAGAYIFTSSSLELKNSIIADSSSVDCQLRAGAGLTIVPTPGDQSIVENDQCGLGRRAVDPRLLPLADNDRARIFNRSREIFDSATHAFDLGSPVRNAGANGCAVIDQRGFPRNIEGSGCDIGAFEQLAADRAKLASIFVIPTANGKVITFPL